MIEEIKKRNKKRRDRWEDKRRGIIDCAEEWCGECPCAHIQNDLPSSYDDIDKLIEMYGCAGKALGEIRKVSVEKGSVLTPHGKEIAIAFILQEYYGDKK